MSGLDYESFKEVKEKAVVLDVRNREEVVEGGQIPGSHCVPFKELEEAFQKEEEEFKKKYGFAKPSSDCLIVTHCNKGGRALKASNALNGLGYSNAKCYSGSFRDWESRGAEIIKPGKPFSP